MSLLCPSTASDRVDSAESECRWPTLPSESSSRSSSSPSLNNLTTFLSVSSHVPYMYDWMSSPPCTLPLTVSRTTFSQFWYTMLW